VPLRNRRLADGSRAGQAKTIQIMNLHLEFLHADTRGESAEASLEDTLKRTLAFSWDSELKQAEVFKQCSPAVSLEYPEKQNVLWASIIEKKEDLRFLVCYQRRTPPERLVGARGKNEIVAQADGLPLDALLGYFRLFYQGDFEALAEALENKPPKPSVDWLERSTKACGLVMLIATPPIVLCSDAKTWIVHALLSLSIVATLYATADALTRGKAGTGYNRAYIFSRKTNSKQYWAFIAFCYCMVIIFVCLLCFSFIFVPISHR
jgi:hypothetical protein